MTDAAHIRTLFLLSPAYCGGRRAGMLLEPRSTFDLANRLREGRLTLGEGFAFMSGLYFRGKLAYAERFAGTQGQVLVITPTRGLQPPSAALTVPLVQEFASVDVQSDDPRYRRPLERDVSALARAGLARVVLLGSIATGKYVDVLEAALGPRLHFPRDFVGRGDMSRGGLLLRAADAGVELDYVSLTDQVARHGSRPPRLPKRDAGSAPRS